MKRILTRGPEVIIDSRLRSSFVLGIALTLAACTAPVSDEPPGLDTGADYDNMARHRPPPPRIDAGQPPPPVDGGGGGTGGGGGSTGGNPASAGVITCYTEGAPNTTCNLPTQCCFGNYSAAHDGECSTQTCAWGTIDCDGPEDCPTSQHCCAHVISDPDNGITGYKLACQSAACGAAPASEELCHPTTTSAAGTCPSASQTCVSAQNFDTDLPRTLHICQ